MNDTKSQQILFPADFLATIERLKLDVRQIPGGRIAQGAHLSRDAGASLDFRDYRAYNPGDDLRRVDWNVYRRTGGHLFVRRFDQPAPASVYLLLDDTASMFVESPNRYTAAAQICAAVGAAALRNHDPLAIIPFSAIASSHAFNGRKSIPRFLQTLASIKSANAGSLEVAVDELQRSGRAGVAVVISDCFEEAGVEPLITQLRRINHRLVLVQITQPWDATPDLSEAEELIDCESGRVSRVAPSSQLLRSYVQAYNAYQAALSKFASARGAIHVKIDATNQVSPQLEQLFPAGILRLGGSQ